MTLTLRQPWEHDLLALAQQARQTLLPASAARTADELALAAAYNHCEALTAEHSRSFYMASRLLPVQKRRFVRALYAFCRVTDDIVDYPGPGVEENLRAWRGHTLEWHAGESDPTVLAWRDMCRQTAMPLGYASQLIDGVARDLEQTRYATFDDLAVYCYGVASTVGLMSMHILDYESEEAVPYAIKLGVALQLTNILRDVAEDWRRGRLYLPLDELAAFGLSEDDIAQGQVDERWRSFMRFQIGHTRRLYAEAEPGIALLHRDGRFSTAAAAGLYAAILDKIEAHDYDVFSQRAVVSGWGKLSRLPGFWWRTRDFQYQ